MASTAAQAPSSVVMYGMFRRMAVRRMYASSRCGPFPCGVLTTSCTRPERNRSWAFGCPSLSFLTTSTLSSGWRSKMARAVPLVA